MIILYQTLMTVGVPGAVMTVIFLTSPALSHWLWLVSPLTISPRLSLNTSRLAALHWTERFKYFTSALEVLFPF